MKAPPSQVLILSTADSTVFLGPPSTWGMEELGSFTVLDKWDETSRDRDALQVLHTLKGDSWQVAKLRTYLAGPAVIGHNTYTVRTTRHDTGHLFETLRSHLRSHRLRAVVIRNHHGQATSPAAGHGAAPQAATAPLAPLSPGLMAPRGTQTQLAPAGQVGAARAPANIADWSVTRRLDALLEDSLPLLGQDLRAHLHALMTGESLIRLTEGLALMAGLQAIPGVGEAADAVFLGIAYWRAGWDGLRAVALLARAIIKAVKAQHEADIAGAAPDAAHGLSLLGSAFLDAVILRMAKRSTSGGGSASGAGAESETAEAGASRGQGVGGGPAASATGAATAGGDAEAASAAGGATAESPATAEQVGHPVNPATGVVFTSQTDFTLPGPLPLVFGRIWMSCSTLVGDLGHGWHHTLDMALLPRPDGRHALRLADGRFVVLDTPAPGTASHDAVERIQLCWQDGSLVAVDYDGTRFGFGPLLGQPQLRRLVSISDPNTNAITLTRDARGGLLAIRDSAGRELAVRRDGFGRILGIDAPHPDGDGLLTLVAFEYDRHGDLIVSTDAAGGRFRYGYERHLLVEEQRPAGLCFRFSYDNTAYRTQARCVYTTGDHGLYERELAYDDAARTTTVRSGRGGTWRYEWNAQGRVTAITNPLGRRSTRRYAPDGLLLVAETRADGATRSRSHDRFGRVVETRDFDGARRAVRYADPEPDGLVTALPVEIATPSGAVERFAWDDRLNLLAHTDAAGRTCRFLRDTRGLPLAVQDALGPLRRFGWTERGELAWENAGDGTRRQSFAYDPLGRLSESGRAGEAPTRYVSDQAGRLVEIRRADGGTIRLTRDLEGHVISHQDAIGAVTRWTYDGLPLPTRRLNPDGSSLTYRYDTDLNLVGLTNQKGERYTLRYDLADQLAEEVGFDGRRRSYQYDKAGYLITYADAEARGGACVRDGVGRLLERRHSDGLTDRYAYDAAGALTLAANDWGEIRFAYAPNGALLEETGPSGVIRHRYDPRSRRVATTLPDDRVIETGYDAQDNVILVSFGDVTVATFGRDALGRESERHAGALTTSSEYDPQGRLARQTAQAGGMQPLIERRYRWDNADRLIESLDLARGVRRYQYDANARLTAVSGDLPEHFVIDPAGNILTASGDSGAGTLGVATGDRLLLRGDRKFEYDGCGNRVREVRGASGQVERLYRYRADNQLAEVEERSRLGRRLTAFRYDALGRRTVKESTSWGPAAANDGGDASSGTTMRTDFVWSGNLLIAESTAAADPLATVYLHELGSFRPLAQVRRSGQGAPGTLYHYHLDHLGTPQEVTNDDGRIVWQARFKAWGALASVPIDEVAQPIRFQGQYQDAETGLFYNRFRYYAPDEGCYLHQDPIGLTGGSNLSAYVHSPTGWIDPWGLASCDPLQRLADRGFTGVERNANGGLDYSNSNALYNNPSRLKPDGTPVSAVVRIKYTGDYNQDFQAASQAGFGQNSTPSGYTWHHVDDYDPETGEGTMQLVNTDAHQGIPHIGGVSQYRQATGDMSAYTFKSW